MIKVKKSKSSTSSISSPKSLNDKKNSISSVQEIQITQNNLLQSPKRVIKALYDYKPQGPGELEFQKGDFFHVIGNENDPEWYEACNPSRNLRGMVPVPYFEVFGKTRPVSNPKYHQQSSLNNSPSSKKLSTDSSNLPHSRSSLRSSSSSNTLYAIVLYEFKAERSDELDVNIGENIILCAHHDYEWFIAKPIDRLGGPGLVPVSYVSIINILTGNSTGNDVIDDINMANLPTVDDWKNKNARYKASSIPLGQVEELSLGGNDEYRSNNNGNGSRSISGATTNTTIHQNHSNGMGGSIGGSTTELTRSNTYINYGDAVLVDETKPYIVEAQVDSYQIDNGRYWFHMVAKLSNGEIRSLCRYYDDFYDFQIKLLEYFPQEAGRQGNGGQSGQGGQKRILPFIPGPLTYVTDKITKKRQIDLNDYVQELISLPKYISQSNCVKKLFEFKHPYDHTSQSNEQVDDDSSFVAPQGHYDEEDPNSTIVKEESVKTLNAHNIPPPTTTKNQIKLKFYYKDDIFALLINEDSLLDELREKIKKRIYDDDQIDANFKIFIKSNSNDEKGKEILTNDDVSYVLQNKFKILIDDE
ncbi:hypothetical protein BN7_3980 [Wickerhamomyces ciferrii]|uniref:Bud emergence protein 1 n=1 Tax=Wickerhamomyces ciferrii (strain ATCC 14091 / BCRC 22168 / CBS 111 / JCM 3599 / NBRC 0793 / NRRL Y-1031 F-60-10) TaxID=1206466 RepID=K0KN52_WICCF|nr:uncharacterized protein BN7_3980 [Wickerhamomyces ciferrii]CCH44416.1 hypothetical protein BN7_3980 [Wickerhamomyces ciferrii]